MAGEWLKFESTLPEKPETLAITSAMGWTDPDLTVGKLMRLFRWFDQQTVDGNASRVTPALLDQVLGVTGLTLAVASVGWISVTEEGLSLAKFDRHNGESAKQRAQTAKRVAKFKKNAKANDEGNDDGVSSALPREEKRREEKKDKGEPVGFPEFWPEYPNHAAKAKAVAAWGKIPAELHSEIMVALAVQKRSPAWTKDEGQFVPHAATWLNGKRWEDQPTTVARAQTDAFAGAL